jgi:hypothetical protein
MLEEEAAHLLQEKAALEAELTRLHAEIATLEARYTELRRLPPSGKSHTTAVVPAPPRLPRSKRGPRP